jgi:hypothetical protein
MEDQRMATRNFTLAVLASLMFGLWVGSSPATTYYIDAQSGLDTNAGTSPTAAWKTIQKVNSRTFAPGDNVLFKRGLAWREQLNVPSSGVSGRPITFGAYGTGANPVIYRTERYTRWWEQSLIWNGGFEDYDLARPSRFDIWYEQFASPCILQADTTVRSSGTASIRLAGNGIGTTWADGAGAVFSQTITIARGKPYYITFKGRSGSTALANLALQLKDTKAAKYFDGATGLWSSTNAKAVALSMYGQPLNTWVKRALVVTVAGTGATSLSLTFGNFTRSPCWIDEVYVTQGTKPSATRIWAGRSKTGYGKIRGVVRSGVRGPETSVSSMDAVFATGNQVYVRRGNLAGGYFWYRQDSGVPPTLEVGARMYSILVLNKAFVTIDSIDATGPGAGISSGDSERGLIMIDGTSSNVVVRNGKLTNSSGPGILTATTARDIRFENLEAAFNQSTGISMNARGGVVQGCRVHHNCQFLEDKGDGGGIGVTDGANITIIGNNVYSSGPPNGDADPEIAVVGIQGPITITRNYIHDCFQGGILIAEGAVTGTEVSYNLIQRFGTSTYPGPFSTGRFAGISLAGVNSSISGVRILNNTIVGGRSAAITGSGGITVATAGFPNLTVKNNLFSDNTCPDVMVGSKANTSGVVINYNLYYKARYTHDWVWRGWFYDTMTAWRTASKQDLNSLTADPQFTNLAAGDFTLKSTSPAIDKGVVVGLTRDYQNTAVPQSTRPDIGAFEFVGTPTPQPLAPETGTTAVTRFDLYR